MSILEKILNPAKALKKWAIELLLKEAVKAIPLGEGQLAKLWAENQDEIIQKVSEAITKTLDKLVKKALEKQGVKILAPSDK